MQHADLNPIIGVSGGKWVYYQPYPDERTYEQSKSWTDAIFRQQLREVGLRVAQAFEGKPDAALHEAPPQPAAPTQAPAISTAPQPHTGKTPGARTPSGKVGRNDPCPCGSGRKYKKCCGR